VAINRHHRLRDDAERTESKNKRTVDIRGSQSRGVAARRTALGRPARRAAILPGVGKAGGADLVDAIDIVAGSASFGKTTLVRVFDLDAGIDTAAEKVAGRL
jgi:hypothetical protein